MDKLQYQYTYLQKLILKTLSTGSRPKTVKQNGQIAWRRPGRAHRKSAQRRRFCGPLALLHNGRYSPGLGCWYYLQGKEIHVKTTLRIFIEALRYFRDIQHTNLALYSGYFGKIPISEIRFALLCLPFRLHREGKTFKHVLMQLES